ncbi:MAG: hypothetical protein NXH90_11085 [Flavobacteriaceae bacterium]|nr:hypothetical protein [Flavobacteriaceae bacterium]
MKKILGYTVLFLLMGTGMQAQDFDLGDIMGEAQDFFGEAQDDAEKAADTEAQEKFKEAFNDKFKKWGAFSENLDDYSPQTKCLYLMAKYILELEELKVETGKASECRRTYDLYGMQLTAMMSSTTIMFCSEELFNTLGKVPDTITEDVIDYLSEIKKDFNLLYSKQNKTDFEETMVQFYINKNAFVDPYYEDDLEIEFIKINQYLLKYFHPLSLMKEGVAISQQMDRLKPCTGY